MNHEERVSVLFDRYVGALSITMGSRQITVDSLPANTEFLLSGDSEEDLRALWLSSEELDYLIKMIRHILDRMKISEGAREALSRLLPRAEALLDEAKAAR
ncbi:MAG: hypothetical protein RMM58_07030 [Chloroflexota bacterium]|nr:hypothetical protein [Dehalococcoidia bacterium]MDW8253614.1 hypothetical protein [Chloroflexota bacterium]